MLSSVFPFFFGYSDQPRFAQLRTLLLLSERCGLKRRSSPWL